MFDDPAMLTWLMILFAFVVFLGFATHFYKLRIAAHHRELQLKNEGAGASDIQEVRSRLAVLERIAIDRGHDISAEIEALRDHERLEGPN
jgi:hypothetical protein